MDALTPTPGGLGSPAGKPPPAPSEEGSLGATTPCPRAVFPSRLCTTASCPRQPKALRWSAIPTFRRGTQESPAGTWQAPRGKTWALTRPSQPAAAVRCSQAGAVPAGELSRGAAGENAAALPVAHSSARTALCSSSSPGGCPRDPPPAGVRGIRRALLSLRLLSAQPPPAAPASERPSSPASPCAQDTPSPRTAPGLCWRKAALEQLVARPPPLSGSSRCIPGAVGNLPLAQPAGAELQLGLPAQRAAPSVDVIPAYVAAERPSELKGHSLGGGTSGNTSPSPPLRLTLIKLLQ